MGNFAVTEHTGHYSTATHRHGCTVELYSTTARTYYSSLTTALQLYSVYTLQHSAPPLRHEGCVTIGGSAAWRQNR